MFQTQQNRNAYPANHFGQVKYLGHQTRPDPPTHGPGSSFLSSDTGHWELKDSSSKVNQSETNLVFPHRDRCPSTFISSTRYQVCRQEVTCSDAVDQPGQHGAVVSGLLLFSCLGVTVRAQNWNSGGHGGTNAALWTDAGTVQSSAVFWVPLSHALTALEQYLSD